MNEQPILHRIMLECGQGDTRLFRNNTGQAWQGAAHVARGPEMVTLLPGDVVIRKAQPVRYGLCVGSSDLIGWTCVGEHAVFTAIEVKASRGRVTDEQATFLMAVERAGGRAGVARSVEDAQAILRGEMP